AAPPAAQTTTAPSASVAVGPPAPAVADAGPPKPPAPVSKCKPLGPNEITEDDHPQLPGLDRDAGATNSVEWLVKHDVPRKVALGWYAARMDMNVQEAE